MISRHCAISRLIRVRQFSLSVEYFETDRGKRIRGRIDCICQLDEGLFSCER